MAEYKRRTPSLPGPKDAVDAGMVRRPIRSMGQEIRDMLTMKDTVSVAMMSSVSCLAVFPQGWLAILPSALAYYAWSASRKYKLPFKVPQNWGGTDYGAPKPGGSGFSKAGGILYLGCDQQSQEELWIENGDARRHGFFLGTTGSGKALPLDTPVLTPRGWVMNGDLRPGDEICHPFGGRSKIVSVHPQGRIPLARMWFSDGRHADCSLDHLWHVKARARVDLAPAIGFDEAGKLITTGDLAMLHGLYGDKIHISVPKAMPHIGAVVDRASGILSWRHAIRAAEAGLQVLDYMPSLHGTPKERITFLRDWLSASRCETEIEHHGVRLKSLRASDAKILKQIVWSLGGIATVYVKSSLKQEKTGVDLVILFEGIETLWPQASACRYPGCGDGLEVTQIERMDEDAEMSCIKTDREDGLFVMENHVVTHNTELLLGVVSQTLMWSSGFLFIDGKGTTEFYARAWTLAKRFGREDDIRVLNFTDAGGDPDAPAGGPLVQSNTLNPFAKGGADQLMNLIVGLMGDSGAGNDMWKGRAMVLVTAAMKALVQMRDSGDILLDVQAIRDFLPLGTGVKKEILKNKPVKSVEDVPEEAWHELRTRAGMIELYLRALKGDFSNASKLALKAFFDSLPGFNLEKALKGDAQDGKASEQYGFLSMQLTKPLGSLADDYGHIFRTPLGEVDIDDVVLNRRILIVLLPALQKAPEEMEMCGKIVVNLVKIMMGNASGYMLQGSRQEIVESKQTRAPSPYIVVLDEAGYYMVKGIDVMMAQARSLGFMIIVAGQDMAAMQAKSPQIAETAAANASIFAAGKTVDGDKTAGFIQKIFGRTQVAVTSGYSAQSGFLGNKWVDRMDASFQEVEKVKLDELQNMMEGEFYFLFNGTIVRAATFYIGGNFAENFSVNKFIKVRGPTDRVPGLDQSVEISFIGGFVGASEAMLRMSKERAGPPEERGDGLAALAAAAQGFLWKCGDKAGHPANIHGAWLGAAMMAAELDRGGTSMADASQGSSWDKDVEGDMDDPVLADDGFPEMDDYSLDEIPPSRYREPPRRSTPVYRDEFADILGDGDGAPSDVVRGLASVARAKTTQERHSGLIDVLVAEDEARAKVRRTKEVSQLIQAVEEETNAATEEKRRSLSEFFTILADNSTKFARAFAEEEIDGDLGIEILRRSGDVRPLPLDALKDGKFMADAVGELEKIISTEQS